MRSRRQPARRVFTAVGTTFALLQTQTTSADAQEAPPSDDPNSQTYSGSATLPLPGEISHDELEARYIAAEYGVPLAEAIRQIELHRRTTALLDEISSARPDVYGGGWVAWDSGSGHVNLAVTAQSAVSEARERAERILPEFTIHVVPHSIAELDSALSVALDVFDFDAHDGAIDGYVDVPGNQLVVRLTPDANVALSASSLVERVQDATGVHVELLVQGQDQVGIQGDACPVTNCDPPFRGGLEVRPDANGDNQADGALCTSGFNARRTIFGSEWLATTAGHCSRGDGVNWKHSSVEDHLIGPEVGHQSFGAVDTTIIRFQDPPAWKPTNIIRRPSNNSFTITSKVGTPSSALVGTTYCHVGARLSGHETCGPLVTHNYASGDQTNMGYVDAAMACPGDSGGPWFQPSNHRAAGFHMGSTGPHDQCPGPADEDSAFTWVSYFEGASAATILTAPVSW